MRIIYTNLFWKGKGRTDDSLVSTTETSRAVARSYSADLSVSQNNDQAKYSPHMFEFSLQFILLLYTVHHTQLSSCLINILECCHYDRRAELYNLINIIPHWVQLPIHLHNNIQRTTYFIMMQVLSKSLEACKNWSSNNVFVIAFKSVATGVSGGKINYSPIQIYSDATWSFAGLHIQNSQHIPAVFTPFNAIQWC